MCSEQASNLVLIHFLISTFNQSKKDTASGTHKWQSIHYLKLNANRPTTETPCPPVAVLPAPRRKAPACRGLRPPGQGGRLRPVIYPAGNCPC